MKDLEKLIYKYTIKNAYEHSGKASAKAVLGKIIAISKQKGKTVLPQKTLPKIEKTVREVNRKSFLEIEKEFKKVEKLGFELRKRRKRKQLPSIRIKEKLITRFAPNPNAYMHLGHARQAIPNYEYVRKRRGKFILRFDDTDPKIKKTIPNAKKIYLRDLKWLGIRVDRVFFASDRLERYYEVIEKLIKKGKAYVSTTPQQQFREKRRQGKETEDRKRSVAENIKLFRKMKKWELREGKAVVILKTDIKHKDPSLRDFAIARIVDKVEHPKKKLRKKHLWPLYALQSAVDDHDFGVNLIIRGKDLLTSNERQKYIYKYLGWKFPKTIHTGRMKLEGFVLSKSEIVRGIKEGKYSGFDDPAVATIASLRRRGFTAEALRKAILDLGLSMVDVVLAMKNLIAYNKKTIDRKSKHFPLILDPLEVKVDIRGKTKKFVVPKKRLLEFGGKKARLKDRFNVLVEKNLKLKYLGKRIEHVVKNRVVYAVETPTKVRILMPDSTEIKAVTEKKALKVKRVYFENFGYCRREKSGFFIFTHK